MNNKIAPRIKILPENLVNKIAAGEVVQRPASVVKELIENSIDAQAKSITVIIEEGGKNLIQVVDDGVGMNSEDALLAFERHSTSKIATYEDLENIRTMGFRGEALASIAAVSQVEMFTRSTTEETGTRVKINLGGKVEATPQAGPAGTSLTVRNLFFNTPARKNFLKSTATEYKHVVDVVQRMAIAYPEISWKFISNKEIIFNLPSGKLIDRIADIYGENFTSSLLNIDQGNEFIRIHGFLSRPDFLKRSKSEQYIYLNRRFIINRNLNYAVSQGYENLLLKGFFPIFILFIEINPNRVDVNVHPTKLEVKFDDEGSVYRFVVASVRKVVSSSNLIPEVTSETIKESKSRPFNGVFSSDNRLSDREYLNNRDSIFQTSEINLKEIFQSEESVKSEKLSVPTSDAGVESIVIKTIQLFNKYILLIEESGFYLIDQHAAHERILYEKAVDRIKSKETKTQELLFPQTIQMSASDISIVKELLPHFSSLGFSLKIFSNSTIIVDGVPTDIKPGREGAILQEIIDAYKEDEHGTHLEPYDRLAKSFACKAAIKSGDILKINEVQSLIKELFSCKIPFSCPHGRPVAVKYTLTELDRKFGRTT